MNNLLLFLEQVISKYGPTLLWAIIIFIILYAAIIKFFYLEGYRVKMFKKIADKHKLEYTYSEKRSNWKHGYYPIKKNILDGQVNKQKIKLFDYYEIGSFFGISYTKKSTVLMLNDEYDNYKTFRGFMTGVYPIKKIKETLSNIKQ